MGQGPEQAQPQLCYSQRPALFQHCSGVTEADIGFLGSGQGVGEDPGEVHLGHEELSCLDAMWLHRIMVQLQTCKMKSTQALPSTPKSPDQVLNIFSLLVYFPGLGVRK